MSEEKTHEGVSWTAVAILFALFMVAVASLVVMINQYSKLKDEGNAEAMIYKAQLNECRDRCAPNETLWGRLENCQVLRVKGEEKLNECLSVPTPQCPSVLTEQFKQVADNCTAQLAPIQSRWDAKFRLAQEAIDAAKAAGVGPALRDWIINSDAQMKAREVLLSMQDWYAVDRERADVGDECVVRMVTIVRDLEQAKAYMALSSYPSRDQRLADQVEKLFPDWMRYRQMELNLTREAVGCKDDEPPRGRR
jgi:hypothetical protein